jgi:ribose transport system permease protein/L-arabinose transport system permease protein
VRSVLGAEHTALLAALLAMVAYFSYSRGEVFLTPANAVNIGNAAALLCIVAAGQALVIIGGGFDLSVGAIVGLGSVTIAAVLEATSLPGIAGVAIAMALGIVVGLLNGLIVTRGRVNPLIATLGTLSAFQGVAFLIANGQSITVIDPLFSEIGSGDLLSLPYGVWMAAAVAAGTAAVLRFTDIGRNIYAVGGNPVAARIAGIHVDRYTVGLYAFAGFAAGLGAVLLTARTGSGLPTSGSAGLELSSITAAVLGGCALNGGRGGIAGTVLGVLVLGTLDNGLILMGVPTFWQLVAKGSLLIVAVMVQQRRSPSSVGRGSG